MKEATTLPPEKLLGEFQAPSYETWRKLVEAELKGAPFDKKMITETPEGIRLQPIYTPKDTAALPHVASYPGSAPFVRGAHASGYVAQPWLVSQEIASPTPALFNATARHALAHGCQAISVGLDSSVRSGQTAGATADGLVVNSVADLAAALDGIDLTAAPVYFRTGAAALPVAALLAAVAKQRKVSPASLRGGFELDPLGSLAVAGKLTQPVAGAYREMAALTAWAAQNAPRLQTISVASAPWHESGGNAVEELAFTLATALDYLRAMNEQGLDVEAVAPRIRFNVTVGEQFFTEIAKLRALRMLWSRLVGSLGGSPAASAIALHVRTSHWNKTVVDPYNNLLRGTVEAFASVLGGCDSLEVGAFDEVVRTPDEFSQRIARNTQLVLQKECRLTQVIDPAGGSWYVESLTAELANRAWTLFQEVEKLGGMRAALVAGFPQGKVAATAAGKLKGVTRRRDSIVGVSQYANAREQPLAPRAAPAPAAAAKAAAKAMPALGAQPVKTLFPACIEAAGAGATLADLTLSLRHDAAADAPVKAVTLTRAAAALEGLRAAMQRLPKPAEVFLCQMGSLKEYKARSDFSRGFFSVGGFNCVAPGAYPTPEAAAEAFAGTAAKVAVLCSTDDNYPALVPPLVAALRAKRPDVMIVLAGYPAEQIAAHQQAGVDEFIHIRADLLEVLSKIQARLGIA